MGSFLANRGGTINGGISPSLQKRAPLFGDATVVTARCLCSKRLRSRLRAAACARKLCVSAKRGILNPMLPAPRHRYSFEEYLEVEDIAGIRHT